MPVARERSPRHYYISSQAESLGLKMMLSVETLALKPLKFSRPYRRKQKELIIHNYVVFFQRRKSIFGQFWTLMRSYKTETNNFFSHGAPNKLELLQLDLPHV